MILTSRHIRDWKGQIINTNLALKILKCACHYVGTWGIVDTGDEANEIMPEEIEPDSGRPKNTTENWTWKLT